MKLTVCELSDNEQDFTGDWADLKTHLDAHQPDLLLLPELPFCQWIASEKAVNYAAKIRSVKKHEQWIGRLNELSARYIVYTRPVVAGAKYYNTAFVYQKGVGHTKLHTKCYFPEEPHFWEATWYDAEEDKPFEPLQLDGFKIGALLCTEMWFTQYARQYGKQGVDLLVCPRATGAGSVSQWVRCGQTLAVISGAYCLSSNKSGIGANNFQWGGNGFIAQPMDGALSGITNAGRKFFTTEIDLGKSREAKLDYPLYVKE
ncbi:MAG: carbon-nitrogen hydrolase family protein [Mucilaginibacter sp.]